MNTTMTNSLMRWHLARRANRNQLHNFCQKHRTNLDTGKVYGSGNLHYFTQTYYFDNGSYIKVLLRASDTKSYSVADHFQVIDYAWGDK